MSNHFWTSRLAGDILKYELRSASAGDDPRAALEITDARYDGRIGHDVGELKKRVKESARWGRLTSLLLLTSAFERYLLGAASAAVDSDPSRSEVWPKRVDGLLLKKYEIELEKPVLEGLVRGEWSGRLATYRKVFGEPPAQFVAVAPELERIRKTRNRVAHQSGFEDGDLPLNVNIVLGAGRVELLERQRSSVSHHQVIAWMRMLGDVSEAIDRQLTSKHIGDYEAAAIYLDWKNNPPKFEQKVSVRTSPQNKPSERPRFGKMLSQLIDMPLGDDYTRELSDFVNAL